MSSKKQVQKNRMKRYVIPVVLMLCCSVVCILGIGFLAYRFKWRADKAMVGILGIYMMSGFMGGCFRKWFQKREERMTLVMQMLDGVCMGLSYLAILVLISAFGFGVPFFLSSRFLLIGMLILGASCLGRIL